MESSGRAAHVPGWLGMSAGRWAIAALMTVGVCASSPTLAETAAETSSDYECLIEPHLDVSVSAAVTGVVEKVLVERGDNVKKGQVLVQLVNGIETAAHELARARSEFADRTNLRNADLVEEKLISSNEKDALETDAILARLQMREAREVLELRTIRSPISGVVAEVSIEAGEFVDEEEMMRIVQIDPLNVEVVVPVALYGRIEKGSEWEVRPEPPFNEAYSARVVIVDRVVDAASGTFGLRLELPNKKGLLPAGLKCSVSFPDS